MTDKMTDEMPEIPGFPPRLTIMVSKCIEERRITPEILFVGTLLDQIIESQNDTAIDDLRLLLESADT